MHGIDLNGRTVVVIGGSSGIGMATAAAAQAEGARVVIGGRSHAKRKAALDRLGGTAEAREIDQTDQASVIAFFDPFEAASIDHLVITASSATHGPFAELAVEEAQAMFNSKLWGPYRVAQAALPALARPASITLFSGVLSRRPGLNCSALGAVNAAVEGLTRGLALELGPDIRVNCVAPGMVRSEAYDRMPSDKREQMYRSTGESLPVARVGETDEIAQAVLYLMSNGYTTGLVLDVDGGHMIRQYATR